MFAVHSAPLLLRCTRTCRKVSPQGMAAVCISITGMLPVISRIISLQLKDNKTLSKMGPLFPADLVLPRATVSLHTLSFLGPLC